MKEIIYIKLFIMSKAENRHFTKKWKEKRRNHDGDKCNRAKCGICSYHKRFPKASKNWNKKQILDSKIKVPKSFNNLYDEKIYNEYNNI